MLRRRKWLIMLVTAVGTVAAAMLGMVITPTYTAKVGGAGRSAPAAARQHRAGLQGLTVNTSTIATQIGLMQSETFIASVMDDLHLFDDPEFNPALTASPRRRTALPSFLQPLGQVLSYLPSEWLIATGLASQAEPVLESQAPGIVREKAIGNFTKNVAYLSDGSSYLIQISSPRGSRQGCGDQQPDRQLYIQEQIKGKLGATDKANSWLEQRLAELRGDVQKSDQAVRRSRSRTTSSRAVAAPSTTGTVRPQS